MGIPENCVAESSASSKLKSFFHKTEIEELSVHNFRSDYQSIDTKKDVARGLTYKINPAATEIANIYEVKNSNPMVDEFVSTKMKIRVRAPSLIKFGSNQIKLFDAQDIVGYSSNKRCLEPHASDSILLVKEQDPRYFEEENEADWNESIAIENRVVLEGMLRCWDACGIPESEFDAKDMVMTVQKLSYGILQALSNQGAVSKMVKQFECAELSDDFEECWLDLLEALQLEDDLKSKDNALAEQLQINNAQQKENKQLEERLGNLEMQLDDQSRLQESCRENILKIEELTKVNEAQSAKHLEACATLSKLELDFEEKVFKYEALIKENSELRNDLMTCEKDLEKSETHVERLQSSMASTQTELKQNLDATNEHCNQLAKKCEDVERIWKLNHSLMVGECEQQKLYFQQLQQDTQKAREDAEWYRQRNNELFLALQTAREQIETFETRHREASEALSIVSKQMETLLAFKEKAKTRIISLRNSKHELKARNKQIEHFDEILRQQLNAAIEQCERKAHENQKLSRKLEGAQKYVQDTTTLFHKPLSPLDHKSNKKRRPLRIMTNQIDAY
ncbi:LADA_0F05050g1_1 [Lachancea dasiensis]|uniref:LADA_0F05050g1_1 n=1 Tax=Lachancea dasiensis TaxID=1072105 RepID=A0A1G4JJD9_9SACH|nr:LADA_0F05050g1_1 [Lachancea dasiensis]